MGKIHLLMRKEDIDPGQMENKIAVVFDILLATSTVTAALYKGAKEVVPVLNGEEALCEAERRPKGSYVLSGEYAGLTLEGFMNPSPFQLKGIGGKTMILSTTNGTVAIKNAAPAKRVLVASLLNGKAVAETIHASCKGETVMICSGSMESFCLEDFYGAGYFLDCLTSEGSDWELTDAAKAALLFYKGNKGDSVQVLRQSRVGSMLESAGMAEDLRYVARCGVTSVVPYFNGATIMNDENEGGENE